ncbi:MAG: DUF342 domain-containing protein [Lachnospiraceae bacterium]|nr:DUF342 domain-containing protein [Lachnospiraceae bacterium]
MDDRGLNPGTTGTNQTPEPALDEAALLKNLEKIEDTGMFTNDQIREIEEGKSAGLDVSIYARPEYLAVHMRSIRLGMMEGLDVSVYASPEYDWFQMEEIRIGMEKNLDVRIYADPKIDYSKMRILREGLLEGIYLKPYVKFPAGVMRQVFLSRKSGVDISPFVEQGYREAELESIRIALENNLNIAPYITPDFNGESIKEIATGLERGLEVELYAFPEYNWEQMRELRRGLESRVDISLYKSSYFHAEQMYEIRIGMENGLDVTPYANLMYTAKDMQRMRLAIEEELAAQKASMPHEEESSEFDEYVINISPDEMKATLVLLGEHKPLNETKLRREISSCGIVFGIQHQTVEMLADGKFAGTEAVIALGKPPVDGRDGYYEFLFDLKQKHAPTVRADGSVDHMDLNNFNMVKKGDRIAYYHEGSIGSGGSTVTGRFLKAKNGKEKGILVGKGFIVEEDKKTYVSVMNGRIEMRGGKITITNVLELRGVSMVTGSVVYDGDLHVTGDVEQGSIIKVSGDILIDGNVEAATIECDKSITIRQGVSAGGNGLIKAKGPIQAKYLESANVESEDDITVGYSVNSTIRTKKRVLINSRNGMLTGGLCAAEEGIEVENLGNKLGVRTRVEIGSNEQLKAARIKAEDEIKAIKTDLQTLYNANNELKAKYNAEMRATMSIFTKLENAIYTKELELREKEEQRNLLKSREGAIRVARAVVHGRIFEGVKLSICGVFMTRGEHYEGVSVWLDGERVSITPL